MRLCLKYHGISAPLTILTSEGADPQNYQLIRSMFLHISGLERRLQVSLSGHVLTLALYTSPGIGRAGSTVEKRSE